MKVKKKTRRTALIVGVALVGWHFLGRPRIRAQAS
jgi:hypothetical protein